MVVSAAGGMKGKVGWELAGTADLKSKRWPHWLGTPC